jgi:hypothetical protein
MVSSVAEWVAEDSPGREETAASTHVDEVGMAILTCSLFKSKVHRATVVRTVRMHRLTVVLVDVQNQIQDPRLVEVAGPRRRDRS